MLQPGELEKLERGFAECEASLFLSGLKVSDFGLTVKARILAGEITFDQALDEICAHYRPKVPAVA